MGLLIGGGILFLILGGVLFMNFSPEFGGKSSEERKRSYEKSGHFEEGKFVNLVPTSMDMNFKTGVGVFWDFIKGNPNRQPKNNVPVEKIDSLTIVSKSDTITRLTWFGHSAFLLEIDGKNILLDPMLGESPAPHPTFGAKRYSKELPIEIEKLPRIDAIVISHDHYDHLDYGSIMKLKDKVDQFYMPLGVGVHFEAWGIPKEKIHELNWWDELKQGDLTFTCTPARHFSGRGINDRFATLWSSWIIQSPSKKIFFSGDSGYGPHFKEIGEKYGPFDFTMMECGQYNEKWSNIHMMPEETVQAFIDVKGGTLMPIHWGAFTLALHSWKDPIDRVTTEAKRLSVPITTPKIGQSIVLEQPVIFDYKWWKEIE